MVLFILKQWEGGREGGRDSSHANLSDGNTGRGPVRLAVRVPHAGLIGFHVFDEQQQKNTASSETRSEKKVWYVVLVLLSQIGSMQMNAMQVMPHVSSKVYGKKDNEGQASTIT